MTSLKTVAVIGLGMIGGSVARGLAARGIRILGHDTDTSHLDAAIAEGVVSGRLSPDMRDVGDADAVVIAVYGDAALDVLDRLRQSADGLRLITDVGSTKQTIVAAAGRLGLGPQFIGSHPFSGDHRSGWKASRGDLFENEIVYLCPAEGTGQQAIDCARELWAHLRAEPVLMDAAEHDKLLAWTSHLAHVVSATLALTLSGAGISRAQLGRGGRDVTRLAGGSTDVWTAIALDNRVEIEAAIAGMERELSELREALRGGDREALRETLARARDWSDPPVR